MAKILFLNNSPLKMNVFFLLFCLLFILYTFANNTMDTAGSLEAHQLGSTSIGSAGDIDFFKIKLAAGRTYKITMQSISPATFENQLDLYSPAGGFIVNKHHNIGVNAQITYSATVTGYFYIRASAYSSSGVGTYVISVEDVNTCSAACTGRERGL